MINSTTCIQQPCERGHLYYPTDTKCYRIGTRGPCSNGKVITFDFETRPSIDGISYNGRCHCKKTINDQDVCPDDEQISCNNEHDIALYKNQCFKLYSRGPCSAGAWLVIKRQNKISMWSEGSSKEATCECMPGYKEIKTVQGEESLIKCIAPAVVLADFLNKSHYSSTSITTN